jgi:hypothetical protein
MGQTANNSCISSETGKPHKAEQSKARCYYILPFLSIDDPEKKEQDIPLKTGRVLLCPL